MNAEHDYVVAITGASGAAYALRLLQALSCAGRSAHVVVSGAARQVFQQELGLALPQKAGDCPEWLELATSLSTGLLGETWKFRPLVQMPATTAGRVKQYGLGDFHSPLASGSSLTAGMIICPCSMGTLAAIASGASQNLIHRAADVHLKERRPLILVPRETPLGIIQLENMLTVSRAGATVLPAMPGLYHQPQALGDLIDFITARILDHLRIPHGLAKRWGES
jgi:4-hydroxy-3-polyprenylbenzoate decarboxylase